MKQFSIFALFLTVVGSFGIALAEPPASSGVVTRDSYNGGWVDVDPIAGMLSVLGFDPVQWCTDGATFDLISYSDKLVQSGLRLNTLENAELTASVWPFTVFDCELFTSVPPLATGMASYLSHDNDLFGPQFCEEKNNANAFGRKANGALYSPSGKKRQFSMHTRGIYDCETDSFALFKTKINLTK